MQITAMTLVQFLELFLYRPQVHCDFVILARWMENGDVMLSRTEQSRTLK